MSKSSTDTATPELFTDQMVTENISRTSVELFLLGVKLTIGIVGIIGNLVVCFLLKQMESHKIKFLIISQAVIDLSASVVITVDTITLELSTKSVDHKTRAIWVFHCLFWKDQVLLFVLFAISSYNLIAISIERYITVCHPFWYQTKFSQKAAILLGLLAWMLGPTAQIIRQFAVLNHSDNEQCGKKFSSPNAMRAVGVFMFVWEFFIPCFIMGLSYSLIILKLRQYNYAEKHTNKHMDLELTSDFKTVYTEVQSEIGLEMQGKNVDADSVEMIQIDQTGEIENDDEISSAPKSLNKNMTRTFIFVFLAYVCCWSTNQVLFLQYHLGGYNHFNTPEQDFSNCMAILNSACNPFIYALFMRQYRQKLKSLFTECFHKIV